MIDESNLKISSIFHALPGRHERIIRYPEEIKTSGRLYMIQHKRRKFYQNHDHPNEIVLVRGKILGSIYSSRAGTSRSCGNYCGTCPRILHAAILCDVDANGYHVTNFPSETNCDVCRAISKAVNFSVGKYVMSSHVSKLFSQIKFARALYQCGAVSLV